jgi:hypothetical protein
MCAHDKGAEDIEIETKNHGAGEELAAWRWSGFQHWQPVPVPMPVHKSVAATQGRAQEQGAGRVKLKLKQPRCW